ncbi:Helix-hairpin-helix motif-containing protein [Pelosinus propionicus DSM 13327]|uniref:Helix-hairpin-helix motif-containing protein n=2 Tax=Pelosinus TaxID=365348 RepID=A0A1I4JUL9_9FIRM|nr:Helix-hairpin-helix motif-containing protein [Pelosinus propionicus DSM 13327]
MRHYFSILTLAEATVEELTAIQDDGEITAKCIVDFFANPTDKAVIDDLIKSGVNMEVRTEMSNARKCWTLNKSYKKNPHEVHANFLHYFSSLFHMMYNSTRISSFFPT